MSDVSDRPTALDAGEDPLEVDSSEIWSLPLDIDKERPTPAYLQLREQLVDAISSGALPAGSALPSERGLATTLGLSRMTVRRAFEQLVEAGLVSSGRSSRSTKNHTPPASRAGPASGPVATSRNACNSSITDVARPSAP